VHCWGRGHTFALHHQACVAVGDGSVRHLGARDHRSANGHGADLRESLPPPVHRRDLVQVTQTGSGRHLDGHYCNRIQNDNLQQPGQGCHSGCLAFDRIPHPAQRNLCQQWCGQLELTLPNAIEVPGANLVDPACDALPTDPNDPRVVDSDNDGYPGISVGLSGLITACSGVCRDRRPRSRCGGGCGSDSRVG